MEKVQIGRVVEFYSNSCLVEIKEFKIPCKTPKDQDIVVGDFVEIVPLQDSLEVKGKILNKVQRKTSLKRFHRGKKKVFAANVTNIAILLSPVPLTPKIFIDKWLVLSAAAGIDPEYPAAGLNSNVSNSILFDAIYTVALLAGNKPSDSIPVMLVYLANRLVSKGVKLKAVCTLSTGLVVVPSLQ